MQPLRSADTATKFVHLNVGGQRFMIKLRTIQAFPETLLAKVIQFDHEMFDKDETGAYFFDRNPVLFSSILDYYRTGKIIYPTMVSEEDFEIELGYWQLPIPKRELKIENVVNMDMLKVYVSLLETTKDVKSAGLILRIMNSINKGLSERSGYAFIHSDTTIDCSKLFNFKTLEFVKVDYRMSCGGSDSILYKGREFVFPGGCFHTRIHHDYIMAMEFTF